MNFALQSSTRSRSPGVHELSAQRTTAKAGQPGVPPPAPSATPTVGDTSTRVRQPTSPSSAVRKNNTPHRPIRPKGGHPVPRPRVVVDSRAAPGQERGDRPRGIHVEDASASGEGVMSARTDPPQDRALRRRPRPRSSVARHARERSTVDDVRLDGGGRHVLPAHLAPSADQKSGRATG